MRVEPQTSLYEKTIQDADLEAALDEREAAKGTATTARRAYREADDHARALIQGLDLGAGAPVRVGRYVIERRPVAARSVAFDTEPTTRLWITTVDDDA
jgi:hypothetical protein